MYVYGKNLHSGKKHTFHAGELCELSDNYKYTKFSPSHDGDFNPKCEYGRKEGEWMVRYYILAMAGNVQ